MKKYMNPMLSIVSINKQDIIVTSDPAFGGNYDGSSSILAPDRDSWDAGY